MVLHSQSLTRLKVGCVLLPCLLLLGCGGPSAPEGSSSGSVAWQRFSDVNPAAGIEAAQASFGGGPGGGLTFLILSDAVGSARNRSSADGSETVVYQGEHETPEGRRVDWRCETDGKSGRMTINGSSYPLDQGAFFLVSNRGGTTAVRQLDRDLQQVKPEQESVETLLREERELKLFFAGSAREK